MVWLHPGDFSIGESSPSRFGPQLLMEQNVVLVSPNYRLGPMGFLSLGTDEAPGNLGLRDQNFAIQWVKDESKHFCGDADKITVFGSGSGATSSLMQMITPKHENRIYGVIAQSGGIVSNPALLQDEARHGKNAALQLAKDVGCKNSKVSQQKVSLVVKVFLIRTPTFFLKRCCCYEFTFD